MRRGSGRSAAALGLALVLAVALSPDADGRSAPSTEVVRDSLEIDGLDRTFTALVPESRATGVVIALHGAGGTGARLRLLMPRTFEADAAGRSLIVVYPDGFEGGWNGCRSAAPTAANARDLNELVFLRAIVRRLGADALPVGLIGFSNGGQLALRSALEDPDLATGIVAIGAGLPAAGESDCSPVGQPERVLLIAGTADPISPYDGGRVRLPDGTSAACSRRRRRRPGSQRSPRRCPRLGPSSPRDRGPSSGRIGRARVKRPCRS